ncbi:MAG: hypothetical protein H5T70_08365, partial [Chloroflexi bacterium]|nr:hypothetical protein [Chloroflexota bacterium]
REAFSAFVQREWATYVRRASGLSLGEGGEPPYLLRFGEDRDLQDILPRLIRSGALKPVSVERGKSLPLWAQVAVVAAGSEDLGQRASALLRDLDETLGMPVGDLRWEEWQRLARQWAELGALLQGETEEPLRGLRQAYCARCARVDEAFLTWLRAHYAPLAVQCLPVPHHVYHIPNLLAYERRRHGWPRVALLVLDGMSLADWLVVAPRWGDRHPSWRMVERLLLAQIPTLTPVSRRALIGGVRPAEAGSSAAALDEAHLWEAFWVREGLERCLYARLALDREPAPGILLKEPQALCLVD